MAILTVASRRIRTESNTLAAGTVGALDTAFTAYEAAKAADTTKTYSVRIVNTFWDGTNFIMSVEASYPETNEDPTGQVPLAP